MKAADNKRPELRHERAATIQDDAWEDHLQLDELDRAERKIPAPKITPAKHKALS